jgi:hypothetical protein
MLAAIDGGRPGDDVEGLVDRSTVLRGRSLDILVHDVVLTHLQVSLHTTAGQAHGNLFGNVIPDRTTAGHNRIARIRVSRIAVR